METYKEFTFEAAHCTARNRLHQSHRQLPTKVQPAGGRPWHLACGHAAWFARRGPGRAPGFDQHATVKASLLMGRRREVIVRKHGHVRSLALEILQRIDVPEPDGSLRTRLFVTNFNIIIK
jgi:hypothetical protein